MMRVQDESRSGMERRQHRLLPVAIERRLSEDMRAKRSDEDIEESVMTLVDGYWADFFSPTSNKH